VTGQHFSAPARARRRRRWVAGATVGIVALAAIGYVAARSDEPSRVKTAGAPRTSRRLTRETTSTAPTTTTTASTVAPTTTTTNPYGATGVLDEPAVVTYLSSRSGDITATVYDLDNDTVSAWRPGVTEYTASIVKVDILATLLQQDQSKGTSLSPAQQGVATTMIE
jgi:hypothetical protein